MKPPRPNAYRDTWCGDPRAGDAGREIRVAGWVHRRRDHGGLVFIDLRDRTGLLQVVFHPESAPEAHALAGELRGEDVVSVAGTVVAREPQNVNPEMPTGEVELDVAAADKLADADTPPFPIDEDREIDELVRMRYRYLDLRRDRQRDTLLLRDRVAQTMRRTLGDLDFVELETPMLTRSTPEGARDFLVPSRNQRGSFYALPQSPQMFKQLLMVAGFERYFQIVRCFRDEDPRADRQPEFTQLDLEMSFVEEEDVIAMIEAVMARCSRPRASTFRLRRGRGCPTTARSRATASTAPTPASAWRSPTWGRAGGLAVPGLRRRAGRRGRGARRQRRPPRGAALGAGRDDRAGAEAGGQGAGVGVRRRGRRLALADRQVPVRRGARGHRRRGPSTQKPGDLLLAVADAPATAATRAGAASPRAGGALRRSSRRAFTTSHWVIDFPMFEWNEGASGAGTRCIIPSRRPRATSTIPGRCARRGYDLVLDEAVGGALADAHAAAHHDAVHECDVRLG